MAGYSKTPLVKKRGIKDGFRVGVRGAPRPYDEIVDELPGRGVVRLATGHSAV